MTQPVLIDRPPRIQPELPVETIEIPSPPQPAQSAISQLIQMGLPLLTMVAFMFATMSSGGRSATMLFPMVLMVLSSGGIAVYSYLKEKRDYAAAAAAYNERLVEMTRDMNNYHDQQRRFYVYNYPDKDNTARIVRDARWEAETSERELRGNTRLWERRTTDEDFGVIRLGMGTLPATVTYVLKDTELRDDPLTRAAQKLQEDSRFVDQIPVIISLRPPKGETGAPKDGKVQEDEEVAEAEHARRTPAVHALGIAGDRASVYEFTRAALAHTTVFHAAMDQQLYVLAGKRAEWAWVERLPHCRGDENNPHTCFMDVARSRKGREKTAWGEPEEKPLPHFLETMRKTLAQRKLQLQETNDEGGARGDPTLPLLLVVIDLLDPPEPGDDPQFGNLEGDAAVSILLAEGAQLGAAVIFLVPDRSKVPSGCQGVIEIQRTTPATNSKLMDFQRLHFRYTETGVNTYRYIGEADAVTQGDELTDLAGRMASLEMRQSFGGSLPAAVAFMSFNDWRTLEQLKEAARGNWTESRKADTADWLAAAIGVMGGNKPRRLQFSAKKDGVHGMVAGSTGSGKSELLISLITQMAVTYDPSVVNFVLVDYKGGGAFKEFEKLPHCVDIITNLKGEGVTRMFTAINAELARRQKLNADTQTKNIVDYRKRGLHLTREPFPFLFIIIDEFAEMIQDRGEYRTQLETITRVGRSAGVSLILAAQRPSGVTDQMRSNIKFRICLRVESAGESREMLRRGDAAFLPGGIPGRGYLQVGNEDVDLIQVLYSGDKYVDPTRKPLPDIFWPLRNDEYNPSLDHEPPELYRAIVGTLADLAREEHLPPETAPWPGFLPEKIALTTPLVSLDDKVKAFTADRYLDPKGLDALLLGLPRDPIESLNSQVTKWLNDGEGWIENLDWARHALRPVVGLVDNPYAAQQTPLIVDFPRGHAVVFGASGWGKTTFVRTLAVSLAASHSPDHAHLYLLDLGGRNLSALADLPHVGAVINPDEEGYKERVEQLLRELDDIVDKRKTILSNAGVGDIYQYNLLHRDAPLPGIVVAIDNFTEFKETFGGDKDDVETVLDRFVTLARECKPYGVHMLLTVNQLNALSTQLYNIFTERFTLKLGDAGDYRAIVGASVPDIAPLAGRGYVNIDRTPLSFQVAMPMEPRSQEGQAALSENDELAHLAENMAGFMARSGRTYLKPVMVGALPKSVLLKQIIAREHRDAGLALDETFLPRLKELTRAKWAATRAVEGADWLRVTFGLVSGNRPREMRLEAKADGVHGLIAGGTGSGKSELLMSLIVGLALNYDPSILNFVLVDFKGGGAFEPFKNLPHVVDIVTNLNRAAVRRMFTAIGAEIERRQRLTTETGVKDIVDYRRGGHHLTHAPMPHLFVIIDEYAEMISESPEFKAELDRITRVGRSAGINLLLAAQRPAGVTDQMRANIKYRICLRVEETDTSREMLRRSDAAYLPNGMPGRGYLQVGNDNIELMQTAYTGETYPYAPLREGDRAPKFYDVIVDMAAELLAESGAEKPRTPWPLPLDARITLGASLDTRYFDPRHIPAVTLGREMPLSLNPYLTAWAAGRGAWPGVDWTTQAMRAVAGLMDDPYNARQLPLTIDFNKGHAVIFGASGWGKTTFLRTLVVSLAATHSPDEFWAHVLDLGGRNLETLRQLPHVGTVILPDEPGYQERVQQLLRELNEKVDQRKQLFARAGVATLAEYNALGDQTPDGPAIEPAILVLIDNFGEYIETFGGDDKAGDQNNLMDALVSLIRQSKAFGVHFVITASRLNVLSGKLYSLFTERYTLRIAETDDYASIVGARIGEIEEIPGRGYTRVERQALAFQVALPLGAAEPPKQPRAEAEQLRAVAAAMDAHIKAAGRTYRVPLRVGALPKSSLYRQVVAQQFGLSDGRPFLDELKDAMARRWAWQRAAANSDWLKVTLGIASGMKPRALELEAKKDGVHGMLAGGTGSGKSEALMTLIVGLALNYPPDLLNFVLVDYKGGGAFKPFEGLPHVVDIVTNLNKAAVNRMFTAINAEIRRRQKLNADTGTKDIVHYREKGLHLTREPYPHLFIIIDEYAEMIDDHEEFKAELESITRVGRSQGVNLILASQRPKGVTDQMRANIKLKLCLRVEQTDTSSEMLRRPDAAFLPSGIPGRGYLQVGNEPLELVQVSWTGETQPDDRAAPVMWPERPGRGLPTAPDDAPRFFDAAVMLGRELTGGRMARKPWPAFLPALISLQSELYDAQADRRFCLNPAVTDWLNGDVAAESFDSAQDAPCPLWPGVAWGEAEAAGGRRLAFRPVVGLVDDPLEARQFPLRFDLTREHLAVFGDSGWGKTSFLRSLIVDLAATHTPDEFRLYVVDLGGRNYRSLEQLPHLGAVIYGDEETFEERLQRLMDRLASLADERSQLLAAAGENTVYRYNERFPDRALPAVLVVIDNFAPLHENYEMFVEAAITPLVRRCLAYGITFAVAVNAPNNMPSRLLALFGEQITFKQSNPDRYTDIVGRGAIEIDDIAGRGYIRVGRRPLLFQAALPVGAPGADGRDLLPEAAELARLAANLDAYAAGREWRYPVGRISVLPEVVPLLTMLTAAPAPRPGRIEAVLGQSVNLQPAVFDLRRAGQHLQVVGPPVSGKTTVLYNLVFSLAYRYSPDQVWLMLVDPQRRFAEYGGRHTLAELPHVVAVVNELTELADLLPALREQAQRLAEKPAHRELFVIVDNYDDIAEDLEKQDALARELGYLARRYGRNGLHFVAAGALEGGLTDFKRAVQATNYGIGLRNADALQTLRVLRFPASLRSGKDLAVGRGYAVKSGLPTMLQVASPYDSPPGVAAPPAVAAAEDEDADRNPPCLDAWVEMLTARRGTEKPAWFAVAAAAQPAAAGSAAATGATSRLTPLLKRALRWNAQRCEEDEEAEPFMLRLLGSRGMADWNDENTLREILREAYYEVVKVPKELYVEINRGPVDDASVLVALENELPLLDGDEPVSAVEEEAQ